jgi:Tol biopolymer transport system component
MRGVIKSVAFVWLAALALLLPACGTIMPSPTPTTGATTTPLPISSPEPPPTPTPGEPTVAPPPGLIYRTTDGIWRIEADADAVLLTDRVDVILSPDALQGTGPSQALFVRDMPQTSDTDIWIIDLDTGYEWSLTGEANRMECCPQWWPGGPPHVFIFGSWPLDAELGPSTGFLTAAAVDGSWYLVLDEQSQSNALPAPAADGGTIAWDRAGAAWLYRWGAELEPFDVEALGLSVGKSGQIASPAWSPDGRQLAWVVGGDFGQGWQIGVGVFDLGAQTSRLLHPYAPLGRGGWPAAPTWSPNGQWLAYIARDQDLDKAGLWVVRADGEIEHFLGPTGDPVWSPDGKQLVFSAESGVQLADIATWRLHHLDLPPEAQPVAWVTVEQ